MRRTVLLLALAGAVALGVAQEKKAGKAEAPANPMNVPQIPEMARLEKALAGKWTFTMTFQPMPGVPGMEKGGKGRGRETVKRGPNGNSLIADMTSTSSMGPFSGHGLIWWDARTGAYKSVWCDTGTAWCDDSMTGRWVGDELVFEGDSPMPAEMGGGTMHMIQKYKDITPTSFTFTIDGAMGKAPVQPMMSIQYKRAVAKPAQ